MMTYRGSVVQGGNRNWKQEFYLVLAVRHSKNDVVAKKQGFFKHGVIFNLTYLLTEKSSFTS